MVSQCSPVGLQTWIGEQEPGRGMNEVNISCMGREGGNGVESRKNRGENRAGDNGGRKGGTPKGGREGGEGKGALMAMKHDIINGCRPKCLIS